MNQIGHDIVPGVMRLYGHGDIQRGVVIITIRPYYSPFRVRRMIVGDGRDLVLRRVRIGNRDQVHPSVRKAIGKPLWPTFAPGPDDRLLRDLEQRTEDEGYGPVRLTQIEGDRLRVIGGELQLTTAEMAQDIVVDVENMREDTQRLTAYLFGDRLLY